MVSFSKVEKNKTNNLSYILFTFIYSCIYVFIQQIFMESPTGDPE